MFSSKNGVASLMPCSTLSAMWKEKPMQRPAPSSPSCPARARASRKAWPTFSLAPPGAAARPPLVSGGGPRLGEGGANFLIAPAGTPPPADDALDVVLGHEVERPR